MMKARIRLALCAALAACGVAAAVPSSASAVYTSYYNCVLKPPGQWCDGRANGSFDGLHSWDYNYGWYPGAWDGTVWVCEHVWRPATGHILGNSCSYNWTAQSYGNQTCICLEAEVLQQSGGPHSVNGYAEA